MTVCVCPCAQPPRPPAILPRLPTSPRLGAQATVGGCHWEVILTAMSDSLGGRKERILTPLAQDTPLLFWEAWAHEARQDGPGWVEMLLARKALVLALVLVLVPDSSTPSFLQPWGRQERAEAGLSAQDSKAGSTCPVRVPVTERHRSHVHTCECSIDSFIHSFSWHLLWYPELRQTQSCPPNHPSWCEGQTWI